MLFSSGLRSVVNQAVSWTIGGMIIAVAFVYIDELKSLLRPTDHLHPSSVAQLSDHGHSARQPDTDDSVPQSTTGGYVVTLEAGRGGHYNTTALINGREVAVLIDTGATFVGLTFEDAQRAGVFVSPADFKYYARTANGRSRVAIVKLGRVAIGDIVVRNVRATVHERGTLGVTLLGMSFLGELRRTEMRKGQLIMEN